MKNSKSHIEDGAARSLKSSCNFVSLKKWKNARLPPSVVVMSDGPSSWMIPGAPCQESHLFINVKSNKIHIYSLSCRILLCFGVAIGHKKGDDASFAAGHALALSLPEGCCGDAHS